MALAPTRSLSWLNRDRVVRDPAGSRMTRMPVSGARQPSAAPSTLAPVTRTATPMVPLSRPSGDSVSTFKPVAVQPLDIPAPKPVTPTPAPVFDDGKRLGEAMAGVSTADAALITDEKGKILSDWQRAERNHQSGVVSAVGERGLAMRRANMGQIQNQTSGMSAAADSGFGWGPGLIGNVIQSAAQQGNTARATAENEFATAQAALERMRLEAEIYRREQEARLVRRAAQLHDTAATIRRYGAS